MTVAERRSVRETVREWVDESIEAGTEVDLAYGEVAERIAREGLLPEWWGVMGGEVVRQFYGKEVRTGPGSARQLIDDLVTSHPRAPEGERRVVVESLRTVESIYDSLHKVGSEWIRLGDMQRHHTANRRDYYTKLSRNSQVKAGVFEHLTNALDEGQVVRARFSEEELAALFSEMGG